MRNDYEIVKFQNTHFGGVLVQTVSHKDNNNEKIFCAIPSHNLKVLRQFEPKISVV